MTNAEIMAQILSEASGRPLESVQGLVKDMAKAFGSRTRLNEEVPHARAQELLAQLRTELPGIRAWLAQGRLEALDEMERSTKH